MSTSEAQHRSAILETVREAGLRWFGRMQRGGREYIGRRMLNLELPGRKQRARQKRRFIDVVREDMQIVCEKRRCREERERWRMI